MPKNKNSIKYKKRKKDACKILHSVYKFLKEKSDTIVLKKIRGMDGNYSPDLDEIAIDYRKELLPTLIHEIMHALHPNWCESRVLAKEKETMNAISIRQCKNILRKFSAYI